MQHHRAIAVSALLLVVASMLIACEEAPPVGAPSATLPSPMAAWQYALPDDYYVRVAASDTVVVVAAAPAFPEYHPEERFVAVLERDTGAVRWRVALPCAPFAPAVDTERVCLPCSDGRIYTWQLSDGSAAWIVDTQGAPVVVQSQGALLNVADGDPEDFGFDGVDPPRPPAGRVRSVEAATGAVRWELALDAVSAVPALAADGLVIATTTHQARGEVLALNPSTGEVRWRTPTGSVLSPPVVTDDAVYVATTSGAAGRAPNCREFARSGRAPQCALVVHRAACERGGRGTRRAVTATGARWCLHRRPKTRAAHH